MKTFKKWLIIKEGSELTDQQNQSIKQLYIMIRDILFDLRNQMMAKGLTEFDHENGAGAWAQFCKTFRGERVNNQWQTVYKPSKYSAGWADSGCGIIVNIPETIKNVFKNIKTPFYLRFPYEEDEKGGLVQYHDGTTDELRISLKHLIEDFDRYKLTIQHELQHLVDTGTDIDHSINNVLLKTIKYLCNPGEISAFAKQYAYIYYKSYPNDQELDFNKFKNSFYKKNDVNLNNYINFGEDMERLIQKYSLQPKDQQKMKLCYNNFITTLKRSFLYFKQKSSQTNNLTT